MGAQGLAGDGHRVGARALHADRVASQVSAGRQKLPLSYPSRNGKADRRRLAASQRVRIQRPAHRGDPDPRCPPRYGQPQSRGTAAHGRCRGALSAGTAALRPARMDGRNVASGNRSAQIRSRRWRESDAHPRDPDDFPADQPGGKRLTDSHPGHRAAGPPGPAALATRARWARWRLIELLHPIPSVVTTVTPIGFALVFGLQIDDWRISWIAAIMLLVQFSISALNEWADQDLDARSNRRQPTPLGLLSPRTAVVIAVVGAVAALLLRGLL